MSMQESVLYIVLALLCVVIYLLLNQKKNKEDDKSNKELERLKDSLTNSTLLSVELLSTTIISY